MAGTMLRAGDDRSGRLVCVHPVSGRAADYAPLAAALDWPGPVLGIDAPEPAVFDAAPSLAALASGYVDALDLGVPVLLLGASIGGVIAAEMSRIIAARGGTVAFLGALDSRAPQPEMRTRPTDRASLARFFVFQAALAREVEPIAPPASAEPAALLAALRTLGAAGDIVDEAALERRLAIFMGLVRAFFHHTPGPLPVPLHLFEASEAHPSHPRPPTLGWDDLAPRLERHAIAGSHFTLLAPRHAATLAATIRRCLPR